MKFNLIKGVIDLFYRRFTGFTKSKRGGDSKTFRPRDSGALALRGVVTRCKLAGWSLT